MIAQQLIKKYKLAADSYYTESPYKKRKTLNIDDDETEVRLLEINLILKLGANVPNGWYGFDLGYPVPAVWYKVIYEFLGYVKLENPNFQILQIKLKFGGIRIYLSNVSESIQKEVDQLEAVLYDKYLIW